MACDWGNLGFFISLGGTGNGLSVIDEASVSLFVMRGVRLQPRFCTSQDPKARGVMLNLWVTPRSGGRIRARHGGWIIGAGVFRVGSSSLV